MTEPLTTAAPPASDHTDRPTGIDVSTFAAAGSTAAELVDLRNQLANTQAELTAVRGELDTARRLRDIRESEFTDFDDRVVRVAMKYARRHGWCSEVTRALDELGLQPPDLSVSGTFTVTYSFTGTIANSDYERLNSDWISQSLDVSTETGPTFDSDWSDVEVTVECVAVDSYSCDDED